MGIDRRPTRAFTLIEILVAAAVLAALTLMLTQIAGAIAGAWASGTGSAERRQSERALADFIGQELRVATLPINGGAAPAPNLQFILNPTGIPGYPSALFWQAPVATDNSAGDLAEIGYFVRWDLSGSVPRAQLCRFFVNPGDANYLIHTNAQWVTPALVQAVAPADAASGFVGLFAENVIGFWARCFDADGTEIAPADGTYDSRLTGSLPAAVEISFVSLDSRAAARLSAGTQSQLAALTAASADAEACMSSMLTTDSLKGIATGARAYTTRVYLENAREP